MDSGSLHRENREWAFESLDALQRFLEDEDFHGDAEEERAVIDRRRKELAEAKYRVVLLGAFNVGKSTLVNALLGDDYLPTVLEECTAKITHVAKSDEMGLVVALSAPASETELRALDEVLAAYGVEARVSSSADSYELAIVFTNGTANAVRTTLNTLITMRAEEDYPQLRGLRAKFDEIFLSLPDVLLEDDIALVDSPGVHTMSQSNEKLTHDIIPHSHLVVCLIDGQSAGNNQDREFIEMIVKHRLRKVVFVINKSDQLNPGEIDVMGHHGPAKDLYRSLQGIVDGPELFFVSSLYALTARRLMSGHCTLDALDADNKIRIPFSVQREMLNHESPEQAAAEYLMGQSRFGTLKERLLDYLYHENREGAVLESVCRFLSDLAWKFLRPLEVQLEMARNIPRLAELKKAREALAETLDVTGWHKEEVTNGLAAMAKGGEVYGTFHTGYGTLLETRFTKGAIESDVIAPLRQWMAAGGNLRKARRTRYRLLQDEAERLLNAFLARIAAETNEEIDAAERPMMERMAEVLKGAGCYRPEPMAAPEVRTNPLRVGLAASYFGFFIGGAAMFSAIGGVFGTMVQGRALIHEALTQARAYAETALAQWPQYAVKANLVLDNAIKEPRLAGTVAGLVLGGLGALVLRKLTARGARRRRVDEAIVRQVNALLLGGQEQGSADSAKAKLLEQIEARNGVLLTNVREAFDAVIADLTGQLRVIEEEEAELRAKQEAIIARVEPKAAALNAVMATARDIAEANAPKVRAN